MSYRIVLSPSMRERMSSKKTWSRLNVFNFKIVNQIESFSQNMLKSIFFWLRHFLVLIFEFWNLLINFVWLWVDLTKGNSQNQAKKLLFWGISSKLSFFVSLLFLVLIFLFSLFFLFIYVVICLLSLGVLCFIA